MRDQVGIVIVTYNSGGFLRPCLEAALKASSVVVVVDNGSSDDSVAIARRMDGVRVVANKQNLGFAGAVNQGFRLLSTPYVLLLNPDAILASDLTPLIEACQRPEIGAATGKLLHPTGEPQFGFTVRRLPSRWTLTFEVLGLNRIWANNPVNRRYRCKDLNLSQSQLVEQPAGAFLLIRREVFEALAGFDERFYPLWFEDVDFLARMAEAGYGVWYEPEVWAVHHGGHSIAQLTPNERQSYWYDSLLHYTAKHFRPWEVRLVAVALFVGATGRIVTGMLGGRGLGDEFIGVLKLAAKALRFGPRREPVRSTTAWTAMEEERK